MKLTKMHGLGNDFILIDDTELKVKDPVLMSKVLCSRRTGIGADGLILAQPSNCADIKMRIFNSDGSEAEMCGNGIRCFSKFVSKNGIVKNKTAFSVETLAGIMRPEMVDGDNVRVDMGLPTFDTKKIPMVYSEDECVKSILNLSGREYICTALLMGVPHLVIHANKKVTKAELIEVGEYAQNVPMFPEGINVDFVYTESGEYHMRTYERGCGITCACGTGACAVFAALKKAKVIAEPSFSGSGIKLNLMLGQLMIEQDSSGRIYMTGPAEEVFETEYGKSFESERAAKEEEFRVMSEWMD